MEVIVSHINLDFDGLASMLAAGKLYPKAKMVLPEKLSLSVKHFLALYKDAAPFYRSQQIDWAKIKKIIMVDTADIKRTGTDAHRAENVQIIIFDHHQNNESIPGTIHQRIEMVGAAVTILIEEIIKNKISISAFEATIMALGIYTDTGFFRYQSTTARDLKAAAFLLQLGANLTVVNRFSGKSLFGNEQVIFNSLMQNSVEQNLKGVDIFISRHSQKEYQGGMSVLASKMLEITGVDVLILVIEMAKKVFLIARSNTELFDVGSLVSHFGGGGHARAASATIKSGDPIETIALIKEQLQDSLKPSKTARDIMSSPVKTVSPDSKIKEVARIMLRYGHSGLPIVKDGMLFGIISRRDVDKANRHGLGHAPVTGVMSKNVVSISPKTYIKEIQDLMITKNIGRLPVLEDGRIVGIVSRTDVLNYLHNEDVNHSYQSAALTKPVIRSLRELLKKTLPREIQNLLEIIGIEADKYGYSVFMVGGIVRDLILEKPNQDIDIVVEGDGIAFAKKIADIIGAEVISHDRFGTAKCKLKSGLRLDISTARMEYYDFPAALPIVERSSLREDLFRRDFTINAMAIQLNRLKYGQLIDYFQGYEDLQQRKIRVLYNLSFVEDPTRILRAIRFEQRFAFRMEEQTLEFVRHSAELIASVSASRLTVELKLIFEETNPVASIKRLQELEVIEYITGNGKKININEIYELDRILNNGKAKLFWASYIATLFYETTDWFEKALRFCPIKSEREVLLDILKLADRTDYKSLAKNTNSLSQIHRYLKNISTEAIAFYIATVIADELVKKKFLKYLLQRDTLVIPLKGGDLKKLGLRPGPIYKRIFEKLEELVLDERITNKEEALEWLKQLSL